MDKFITENLLIISSCPTIDIARHIARLLVEQKLAACVQISSPIESVYQWEGKLCSEPEVSVMIKASSDCYSKIEQLITQHHPYEVPELIALPITHGLTKYLNWIKENSKP